MIRRAWAALLLAAVIAGAGAVYYYFVGSGRVAAWQLRLHPESTLTYPHAYGASSSQKDEDDANGWLRIENTGPTPAVAETQFYTVDSVDKVVAWYEQWLSAKGWLDIVMQGDGSRAWDRGINEQFDLSRGHQRDSTDLWCDAQYYIMSARFKRSYPPAPAFGDPVSVAAVEQRHVGLLAAGASVTDPHDGTAEASARRASWPFQHCCGKPIILLDAAAEEQASPSRSAYHAITLQVAEYQIPNDPTEIFGDIDRWETNNLAYAGFVLVSTASTLLNGQSATSYEFKRDGREAVLYASAYGPSTERPGSGFAYRTATLSIIYDVAPKACPLTTDGCLSLLFRGDASTGWSFSA